MSELEIYAKLDAIANEIPLDGRADFVKYFLWQLIERDNKTAWLEPVKGWVRWALDGKIQVERIK